MQLNEIGQWIGESFRNAGVTAAAFLREPWPQGVEWIGLAVIAVLSAMLNALGTATLGPGVSFMPTMPPVAYAAVSAASTLAFAAGCYLIGGWMGSTAAFRPLFLVVLWLQFLQLAVQFFSLILTVAMPGLGSLIALILYIWVLWLIVVWLDVVWGWDNRLKSFGAILLTLLSLGVIAYVIISSLGISVLPPMPA